MTFCIKGDGFYREDIVQSDGGVPSQKRKVLKKIPTEVGKLSLESTQFMC